MNTGYLIEYLVAAAMAATAFFCKIFGVDDEKAEETYKNVESMLNGLFGYEPEV